MKEKRMVNAKKKEKTSTGKNKKKYDVYTNKHFGKYPATVVEDSSSSSQSSLLHSRIEENDSLILHLRIVNQSEQAVLFNTNTGSSTSLNLFQYNPTLLTPEPYDHTSMTYLSSYLSTDICQAENDISNTIPLAEEPYTPHVQLNITMDKIIYISHLSLTQCGKKQKFMLNNTNDCQPNIACFWDCHRFVWNPVYLPIRKVGDCYYVVGYFCSPECCVSYLFTHGWKYGDIWKQYAWVHDLYGRRVNDVMQKIKEAPPRESLELFGGMYTIDQFRKINENYMLHVTHRLPPLQPLNGFCEEIALDCKPVDGETRKFIPINKERIHKATEELKLKRRNKMAAENTLDKFMNLTVTY